jgi:gas vesicle protein
MAISKPKDLSTHSSINPEYRGHIVSIESKIQSRKSSKINSKYVSASDIINIGGDEEMDNNQILEKYIDLSNQNAAQIKEDMRLLDERISRNVENISTKIDRVVDEIHDMDNRINAKIDSANKWIIGFVITTAISIAAIAITVILTVV